MPVHALIGHLVLITAPLAALLALVYAWRPATRTALRLPLVAAAVANAALAVWAERAGAILLDSLRKAAASAGEALPNTVLNHAHQADFLSVAAVALLITVLSVGWRGLAPGRAGGTVSRWILTACAAAIGWYSTTTLIDALQSVWAQHGLWSAIGA